MLRRQLLIGTLMVVATALFHVACLIVLVDLLKFVGSAAVVPDKFNMFFVMGVAVLWVIAIHSVEAWFWAAIYKWLGQFDDIATAMYFSVVTSTTLGCGDFTLSERWRVLASFQSIGGLILFGASTAFLFEIIRRFLPES